MKDQSTSSLTRGANLGYFYVEEFYQSLDDPTLLLYGNTLKMIFFFKIIEGKLVQSKDFGKLVWEIDTKKLGQIHIKQLCHGFDKDNFPWAIANEIDDYDYWGKAISTRPFFVNVNTGKRIALFHNKKIKARWDINKICDIQQTSKFSATQDASNAKHYSNLKEIVLHFKLKKRKKNKGFTQTFCQLKLSSEAIKFLVKTQAVDDNLRLAKENEEQKKKNTQLNETK